MMALRSSFLLKSFVRTIGNKRELLPVSDVLIGKGGGYLSGLLSDDGVFSVDERLMITKDGILTAEAKEKLLCSTAYFPSAQYFSIKNLLKRNVYDDDGCLLGVISDFIFDDEDKRLTALEVSQGFFVDLLNGRQILPVAHLYQKACGVTYD